MSAIVPEGPRSRILTTVRLARDPYGFYDACRRRYGDTFLLHAWNGDVVTTGDPAVIRDLFRADSTMTRPFMAEAFSPVVGEASLLLIAGTRHREERKLLTPHFSGAKTRAWAETMRGVAEARAAGWRDGTTVVAADELLAISLEVIVRVVFGVEEPERVAPWTEAVRELVAGLHPAFLFVPALQKVPTRAWRSFVAARAHLDELVYAEIARRRRTAERGDDLLSVLLDATYEDGSSPSDPQIRDELVTFLFAGHETTQLAMAWALYRVARAPDVLARLREELDACDGTGAALAKLPYLGAVAQEVLRMTPIVPDMLRTLVVPMRLGPYDLPAGTHVCFAAALVHTRPDLYPEPEAFRPERFLERRYGPHEWLPFGGGARRCIGAAFATTELEVVVGTLLRAFEVESLREETPVRRNATMGPRHGVELRVRRRGRLSAAA